jgi:hypothetical protein
MWANRITRLLRYLKDIFTALLMGVGILLPPPGSGSMTKPPPASEKQTIQQRVANIREHVRREQLRQQANQIDDNSGQRSDEKLSQYWPNWPNWNNWNNWRNNWGNWNNWPNWLNWRNY